MRPSTLDSGMPTIDAPPGTQTRTLTGEPRNVERCAPRPVRNADAGAIGSAGRSGEPVSLVY
jgi:hypothetical protein